MEPLISQIQAPQPQVLPVLVSIDQSWISASDVGIKQNHLLICPVCYSIPLDSPIQCSKCERIFCQKDYDKVVQSQVQGENRCPTCKLQPWRKKQQIHLSYKHMFDSLRLKCKICQQSSQFLNGQSMVNQSMTKDELIDHLDKKHNMYLSMNSVLYDFVMVSQEGVEVKLSWMQNLQINVRRSMGCDNFDIGGPEGKLYRIKLNEMKGNHPTLNNCKLHSFKSQTLKKNKQYILWTVNLSQNQRYNDDSHSIEEYLSEFGEQIQQSSHPSYFNTNINHRYVFYSEELQPIIQKNYQEFIKNIRFNVFCLDVKDYRYIINFSTSQQINTFTKNKKTILRVPIKLK